MAPPREPTAAQCALSWPLGCITVTTMNNPDKKREPDGPPSGPGVPGRTPQKVQPDEGANVVEKELQQGEVRPDGPGDETAPIKP